MTLYTRRPFLMNRIVFIASASYSGVRLAITNAAAPKRSSPCTATQGIDEGGKLEDFDVGGAGGPVVMPADDYVAAGQRMAVVAEIATLKFKFDVYALPA